MTFAQPKLLTGRIIGKLTVGEPLNERAMQYRCACECGETTELTRASLVSGKVLDCGCSKLEANRERMKGYLVRPVLASRHEIECIDRATQYMRERFNPQPKDDEYRNRALLDLAHRDDSECGNCERSGPCEPAHSNMAQHGKGARHKSHDVFTADLCHTCHAWLDQGIGPDPTGRWSDDRADKQAMWRLAFDRTILRRFRLGLFCIGKYSPHSPRLLMESIISGTSLSYSSLLYCLLKMQ